MNMKSAIVLAAAILPLSGCIYGGPPPVSANVAVFHTLDQVPKNATFSVVAWRPDLDRSLEFRSYALELTKIIDKAGYNTVSPGSPADYIVYFDYGIDDGTPYEYAYNKPQWGLITQGETSTTTITGTGNAQTIQQNVTPNQVYGVTGYTQEIASGTTFKRFVNIDIMPRGGGEDALPVMEMRLNSAGSCGSIPTLMPRFMTAIKRRFDDKSGKAGKIKTGDVKC